MQNDCDKKLEIRVTLSSRYVFHHVSILVIACTFSAVLIVLRITSTEEEQVRVAKNRCKLIKNLLTKLFSPRSN